MSGPLFGYRIVEIGGIGPAPYCGMLLGDLGAEVIRLERIGTPGDPAAINNPHARNRRSLAVDLTTPEGRDLVLELLKTADACFEGFRPGVVERLRIGPETALDQNPRLVYGRMTGWGQTGPLADRPGHDINYIALSGVLSAIGNQGERPAPPLNLVGDFGGGGLYLAFGLLAGILEAAKSGQGQVVDCAMIDGTASLMSAFSSYRDIGFFNKEGPGQSPLGGAAHYYGTYETKDKRFVAIGAIEPAFYKDLIDRLELDEEQFKPSIAKMWPGQPDDPRWPDLTQVLAEKFKQKTQDEWCELLEQSDICFAPVLKHSEAPDHRHHKARQTYIEVGGYTQNAPGPRFSRTVAAQPSPPPQIGSHSREILNELGLSNERVSELFESGIVGQPASKMAPNQTKE